MEAVEKNSQNKQIRDTPIRIIGEYILGIIALAVGLYQIFAMGEALFGFLIIFGGVILVLLVWLYLTKSDLDKTREELDKARGPKVNYAYNKDTSRAIIDGINSRILNYLEEKSQTIEVYEANLQTTDPGDTLPKDIELAQINKTKGYTVEWHEVILKTPRKEKWIEKWIKEIKEPNPTCSLTYLHGGNIDWPLINIYSVPAIGECHIGFGEYEELGLKGGCVWIKDKGTADEFQKIVKGLEKRGEEAV